jgi:hypothetical protein
MLEVISYDKTHLDAIVALCEAEGWTLLPSDPARAHRGLTAPGVTTVVAVQQGSGEVLGFA